MGVVIPFRGRVAGTRGSGHAGGEITRIVSNPTQQIGVAYQRAAHKLSDYGLHLSAQQVRSLLLSRIVMAFEGGRMTPQLCATTP